MDFWKARQSEFEKYAVDYPDLKADWRAEEAEWKLWYISPKTGVHVPQQCKDVFDAIARKCIVELSESATLTNREPWRVWLDTLRKRGWGFTATDSVPCTEAEWDNGVKDGRPLRVVRREGAPYTTGDEYKKIYRRTENGELERLSDRELRGKTSDDLRKYFRWLENGTIEHIFATSARFCEELSARAFELGLVTPIETDSQIGPSRKAPEEDDGSDLTFTTRQIISRRTRCSRCLHEITSIGPRVNGERICGHCLYRQEDVPAEPRFRAPVTWMYSLMEGDWEIQFEITEGALRRALVEKYWVKPCEISNEQIGWAFKELMFTFEQFVYLPDRDCGSQKAEPVDAGTDPQFWRQLEHRFRSNAGIHPISAIWEYHIGPPEREKWQIGGALNTSAADSIQAQKYFRSLAGQAALKLRLNAKGDGVDEWLDIVRREAGRLTSLQSSGAGANRSVHGRIEKVGEISADFCVELETRALRVQGELAFKQQGETGVGPREVAKDDVVFEAGDKTVDPRQSAKPPSAGGQLTPKNNRAQARFEQVQYRKAGRKANEEMNRRIAGLLETFGDSWRAHLDEICTALEEQRVPLPRSAKWTKLGVSDWADAQIEDREGLIKVLQHRADWTSQHPLGNLRVVD